MSVSEHWQRRPKFGRGGSPFEALNAGPCSLRGGRRSAFDSASAPLFDRRGRRGSSGRQGPGSTAGGTRSGGTPTLGRGSLFASAAGRSGFDRRGNRVPEQGFEPLPGTGPLQRVLRAHSGNAVRHSGRPVPVQAAGKAGSSAARTRSGGRRVQAPPEQGPAEGGVPCSPARASGFDVHGLPKVNDNPACRQPVNHKRRRRQRNAGPCSTGREGAFPVRQRGGKVRVRPAREQGP